VAQALGAPKSEAKIQNWFADDNFDSAGKAHRSLSDMMQNRPESRRAC